MDTKKETYRVAEIAALLGISRQKVIRLFEREPGVIILEDAAKKYGRRRYRTIVVPRAALLRVLSRKSNGGTVIVKCKKEVRRGTRSARVR